MEDKRDGIRKGVGAGVRYAESWFQNLVLARDDIRSEECELTMLKPATIKTGGTNAFLPSHYKNMAVRENKTVTCSEL